MEKRDQRMLSGKYFENNQKKPNSKAVDLYKTYSLPVCALFILLAGLLFSSQLKAASPTLEELEVQVFNTDQDKLPELEKAVTRIIQTSPSSAFAHYLLANIYIRSFTFSPNNLNLLRKASHVAQQAISLEPMSDLGYLGLASILDLMGHRNKAIQIINQAVELGIITTWRTSFCLGKLLIENDSHEQGFSHIEDAMSKAGPSQEAILPYLIGYLEIKLDDAVGLSLALNEWNKKYPSESLEFAIAKTEMRQSKVKSAISRLQKIQDPTLAREAKINIAILKYQHLQAYQEPLKDLLAIAEENDLDNLEKSDIFYHIASIHIKMNKNKMASDYYVKSVKAADPEFRDQLLKRVATELREEKRSKVLLTTYDGLEKSIGGLSILHALKAELLSQEYQNHRKAIDYYSDAILLNPKSEYYNGLGLAYYNEKDFETALTAFSNATDLNPNDSIARYNEACTLAILGRGNEAIGSLKLAISINPELRLSALNDSDFSSIKFQKDFQLITDQGGQESTTQLSH